jgi:hydroxyacylglutathione hydrolase
MLSITPIPFAKDNYAYLLQNSGEVAILDAGDTEPIFYALQEQKQQVNMILSTHHHYDHIAGCKYFKKKFPSLQIYGHKNAKGKIPEQTHYLQEKDEIQIGGCSLQVLETFGHTQSCISFYEPKEKILFSGDCLFLAGCGRIFEGSIEQMYYSFEKIKKLDKNTKIYFGHNYSINNLNFALSLEPNNSFLQERIKIEQEKKISASTSLEAELASNPFLRLHSPEIQNSVKKKVGGFDNELDLFRKIRYLKDNF